MADHPSPNKQSCPYSPVVLYVINRMQKSYKEHGKAYFIHGNQDVNQPIPSPMETRNLVVDLYNKYYDANFARHFTELLGKHEDIYLSPSTIYVYSRS